MVAAEAFMLYDEDGDTTLYLTILGVPESQPRPRIRRLVNNRVVVYDPSSPKKRACRNAISNALAEIGVSTTPVFATNLSLKVTVHFHVSNRKKDIDNMLKFVLDAMQHVVYGNDDTIHYVEVLKIVCATAEQQTNIIVQSL